ncbi:MAG: hypothetical protein U0744_02465 [Gemmataceae bacterium]
MPNAANLFLMADEPGKKQKRKPGRPKKPPGAKVKRKPVQLPLPWFDALRDLAVKDRQPLGWYLCGVLEKHFKDKGVPVPKPPWEIDDAGSVK